MCVGGGRGMAIILERIYCCDSLRSLRADRAWLPPTLSSLADEKRVGSLLRSTAARDPVFRGPWRSGIEQGEQDGHASLRM